METVYTLSILELVNKLQIRNDQPYEFLNKMTNMEITQRKLEICNILKEEGIEAGSEGYEYEVESKMIDSDILYKLFMLNQEEY